MYFCFVSESHHMMMILFSLNCRIFQWYTVYLLVATARLNKEQRDTACRTMGIRPERSATSVSQEEKPRPANVIYQMQAERKALRNQEAPCVPSETHTSENALRNTQLVCLRNNQLSSHPSQPGLSVGALPGYGLEAQGMQRHCCSVRS